MVNGISREVQIKVATSITIASLLDVEYDRAIASTTERVLEELECTIPEALNIVLDVMTCMSSGGYDAEFKAELQESVVATLESLAKGCDCPSCMERKANECAEEAEKILMQDELKELKLPSEGVLVHGHKLFLN